MSFAQPAGFYLLGLIPILILAHLLHQRRVRRQVGSLLLWKEINSRTNRTPQWRQLLNIHLLLQILAVLLGSLGLAEPIIPRPTAPRQERQILLVDTSASMGSQDSEGSRIGELRRLALAHLERQDPTTEITVVELSSSPRLRGTYSAAAEELRDTIDTLVATDEPGDTEEALRFTDSLIAPYPDGTIHLFTDGAFTLDEGLLDEERHILHLVGGPAPNSGITAFAVGEDSGGGQAFVEITHFGEREVERELRLTVGTAVATETRVRLTPGVPERSFIRLPPGEGGAVKVELLGDDSLTSDDTAYAVLREGRSLSVALVSPGNPFLAAALAVHPRVRLEEYTTFTPGIDADVLVLDRLGEVALPGGRVLAFSTELLGMPVRLGSQESRVGRLLASATHPITKGLDLEGAYLATARIYDLPPELPSLLTADGDPIAYALDQADLRVVSFGFDLTKSSLPLTPELPIIVHRSIEWLTGGAYPLASPSYEAGAPLPFELSAGEEASLLRPDGGVETVRFDGLSREYTNARRVGLYELQRHSGNRLYPVNLLSPEESNTGRRLTPPVTHQPAEESVVGGRGVWKLFVSLLLFLLLADILLPRRRR